MPANSCQLPRIEPTVSVIPNKPSAAVPPSAMMHSGFTMPTSSRTKGMQAAISSGVGLRLLVVCRGVAGRNLTMLEI